LPTAFTVTAVQFSLAALNRRAIVSYLGSVFLFVIVSFGVGGVLNVLQMPTLAKVLDLIGFVTFQGRIAEAWTPLEKNTVVIGLESWMLANRLLWVGLALAILAFTHLRFRLRHRAG